MFAPEQIDQIENGQPLLVVAPEAGPQVVVPKARPDKLRPGKPDKRKQASVSVRNWLRIDQDGNTSMIQADKYKLAHKLGVQVRDLRILDPALASTYPSAILCRERALIVNLEHIKVIITTTYVLVINPEDENVLPFITELKQKLAQPTINVSASYPGALNEVASKPSALPAGRQNAKLEGLAALNMPFELKALEVCLDSVSAAVMCNLVRSTPHVVCTPCFHMDSCGF